MWSVVEEVEGRGVIATVTWYSSFSFFSGHARVCVCFQFDNATYDEAVSIEDVNPKRAAELYHSILASADITRVQEKEKEEIVLKLGRLYARTGQSESLRQLLVDVRMLFGHVSKSRTAKIVRMFIDTVISSPELSAVQSVQVQICQDAIAWCSAEKRTFLKHRLQARLASLYVTLRQYTDALSLINRLIREVKKFDDKLLLVEIFLTESRAHLALQNHPKAKGALTAARSNANSIYCPPALQAEIDLQAGILCSVDGGQRRTGHIACMRV
jgi:26S proteasome regulatory subunit N6